MSAQIKGYNNDLKDLQITKVNFNKELEEICLRRIEELVEDGDCDGRWLALAKTHLEQGFMAMNRAVFQPGRIEDSVGNGFKTSVQRLMDR